ncbi:MAG: 2-phospho-L-lactate transferase [Gammaproteobacteria bacterium]|jgi:LPPG:FO 2-phospho-L-lactate transferase|nr:2-phospho-L-lactate transferase [Gammaproteobacteria bacterium]
MTKILALTGGVGGAKLALGLAQILPPEQLLFAVNTGDDFEHLGLHISPDIDSLTYALAQQNNTETGWGRAGESWNFIETLGSLGGEDWFRLGDKDLALHTVRAQMLRSGASLTEATAHIAQHMGIRHTIAPMSDDPVRTIVHCEQGDLAFQHYFVRERCEPKVSGFSFSGIDQAHLNPLLKSWLSDCDGVIICPSNPFVSVDPLLQLDGFGEALKNLPVVAVSPIVGGIAIKGPAAKMLQEMNMPATAVAIANHYQGLIDGFVVDADDKKLIEQINVPTISTPSVMVTLQDRIDLAKACVDFLMTLSAP